jgi:predicted Ser/Thr protein kinase
MRDNQINDKQLYFVFENCQVHSFDFTQRMYLEEFGKEISDDYEIDPEPIASGSIGQVYRWYSKERNEYLAVKVKHPGIDCSVRYFISIFKTLCYMLYYLNKYHNLMIEYMNNIQIQLNYKQEAQNTKTLKKKWENENSVIVPEVYDFTSSFIVMSYHDGQNYNDLQKQDQLYVSLHLNFIFLTSVLVHDFIHADLHTGNWKVQRTGDDFKIILYDCGIMCETGDPGFNKKFMNITFGGRYEDLIDLVTHKRNKEYTSCKTFLENNLEHYSSSERLRVFIDTILNRRLCSNKVVINILNAFALIGEIFQVSPNVFNKYIHPCNKQFEIIVYIYIGILTNMNKFGSLRDYLQEWMDSDTRHKTIYTNWLFEQFGHKKSHLLDRIIWKKFDLKNSPV